MRQPFLIGIAVIGVFFSLLGSEPAAASEQTVTNSLGMTFVRIPSGSFMMGSPENEPFRGDSETLHEVVIDTPFYIQTTEVTLRQWRAIMGRKWFSRRKGTDQMPVTLVSWFDCQKYIRRLNKLGEGVYRLPTEAEWEYAARAGTTTAYFWGNAIGCEDAMYGNNQMKGGECVVYNRNRGIPVDQPSTVGRYSHNPWGLYDMHGNVWEWIGDWYAPYPTGRVIDPKGPETGTMRVKRGGSWYRFGYSCRSANRANAHPATRLQTTGFRLVREAETAE